MNITRKRLLQTALAASLALSLAVGVPGKNMSESPFPQRVRAPQFPAGLTWLNSAGPLQLNDLRGKWVLLDFWTYCCINCMHILPELKKLEQAHPDTLVVIGVHSAKFSTEQDSKNIAEAIVRYNIEHPVVNDADHAVWDAFAVRAWPTTILVDPEGYAVWMHSGEVTFSQIDAVIRKATPYYRKKGVLDTRPIRFDLEARKAPATPLRYPGKVLADAASERLFIADSSHHRIVVTKLDGTLLVTIGSGRCGRADGSFTAAQFNQPQGMALHGETLFVADTENHLLRRIDLEKKTVATIAGTGNQARQFFRSGRSNAPLRVALNSPWALWAHENDLYIAMAGFHQIWKMPLDGRSLEPYAGSGIEDIVDGPLESRGLSSGAAFAQPSGLTSDGTWLYVADSEGSSIRAVPPASARRRDVRTVVGTSQLPFARLFTFGDVDGPAHLARLQHPLGVAFCDGALYVADTYNNKIKKIDPANGAVATLAGDGKPGETDSPARFNEPAGISAASGKLYVADTNNHRIRVVNPATGAVSTLAIAGLTPPQSPPREPVAFVPDDAPIETLPPLTLRPENGSVGLRIALELPEGHKINVAAPMAYRIEPVVPAPQKPDANATAARADARAGAGARAKAAKTSPRSQPEAASLLGPGVFGPTVRLEKPAAGFTIRLPVQATRGPGQGPGQGRQTFRVALNYYYCREGAEALCRAGSVVWIVPLQCSSSASASEATLRHVVP